MKQVIDGLLYNTDDAIEIAANDSVVGITDFRWFEEAIYKTDSGRWFLWGKGGASSHWREPSGGSTFGPGEAIAPLTESEALAWFEAAGIDTRVVADHFTVEKA